VEDLRKGFLFAALILAGLVVLLELGSSLINLPSGGTTASLSSLIPKNPDDEVYQAYQDLDPSELNQLLGRGKPPGYGIPSLAVVDGSLFFTVALVALSLLLRERLHARIQGLLTFVYALLVLLGAIAGFFTVLAALLIMVALLLAVPFGTLTYLAIYGFFPSGVASSVLALIMALKVGFVVCLLLAQQRFLQNKGLVLLILTSFLGNVVVSFLHSFVPGFLVSISDAVAGLIMILIGAIWALLLLIFSIGGVFRALKLSRV
jgi:hypothetical protein